jgi:hypothetical protein
MGQHFNRLLAMQEGQRASTRMAQAPAIGSGPRRVRIATGSGSGSRLVLLLQQGGGFFISY